MNKACIFCLAKYEKEYIEEFVKYHLGIGFDFIYIYDNEDEPTYEKILVHHLNNVKVIHYPGNNYTNAIQPMIIEDFRKNYMYNDGFTHAAHIDVDEFILLKKHKSIKDFIKDFIKDDCAGITMNWRYFGSSNKHEYENKPLTERFTMRQKDYTPHVKVIFEIKKFSWFRCAHNIIPIDGYFIKDTNGQIITHNSCNFDLKKDNYVQLNHYASKTLPEYLAQRKRGQCNFTANDPSQPTITYDFLKSQYNGKNRNEIEDTRAFHIYKNINENSN
jgi:hypothetical protein